MWQRGYSGSAAAGGAFQLSSGTGKSMAAYLGYGILCFLPLAVNLAEDVKWRYLRSAI